MAGERVEQVEARTEREEKKERKGLTVTYVLSRCSVRAMKKFGMA